MVRRTFYYFQAFLLIFTTSCNLSRLHRTNVSGEESLQHSSYDDSTLNNNLLPVLMPFNRIIDPAGMVIKWGDPNLENHSLDLKQIPGTSLFAVEERNGIVIIDSKKKTVIGKWNFKDNSKYKNLKSTFSGIQVWTNQGNTFIFFLTLFVCFHSFG